MNGIKKNALRGPMLLIERPLEVVVIICSPFIVKKESKDEKEQEQKSEKKADCVIWELIT